MHQLDTLISFTQTHVEAYLFYFLVILAIPCALGVVFDKAVIRSGFMLIGVFGSICGMFLLLQAQFLALAQLMIYAVGITLVVVIALMLTNPKLEKEISPTLRKLRIGGFLAAFITFFVIYLSLRSESWPVSLEKASGDTVQVLGLALTTTYALPFEFASILLLAALVGAVMMAKVEKPPSEEELLDYDEEEMDDEDSEGNLVEAAKAAN